MADSEISECSVPGDPMKSVTVAVEAVTVRERHRDANPDKVSALAGSMEKIGLQTPISVVINGEGEEVEIVLVAGLHRLNAARQLGWADIEAFEVDLDDIDRELWEIDENLCRSELTEAEEAHHLARRKVLWEKRAERSSGKSSPSIPSERGRGQPKQFAAETEAITGQSKRSINQKLARAEALGDDIQQVVGTSLDKGVELDALAKLPEQDRRDIIDRARAGEVVSARKPVAPPPHELNPVEVSNKYRSALMNAWNRAPAEDREWFLAEIDKPVMDRRYG